MTRSRALSVLAVLTVLAAVAAPAQAQGGSASRGSMTLSVSQAADLAPEGQRVTVRGSGYDQSKGIYVAFCVVPPAGSTPTPCGGGADTDGSSGSSVWISDFPPAYGTGLARPYDEGGSFNVEVAVRAQLNEDTDCRKVTCAVVTRADHTRSSDRSLDVLVPVSFAAPPDDAVTAPPAPAQPEPSRAEPPRPAPAASARSSSAPAAALPGAPTVPAETPPSEPPGAAGGPADPAAGPTTEGEPTRAAPGRNADATTEPDAELATAGSTDDGGTLLWPWVVLGAAALAGAAVAAGRALRAHRVSAA